MPVQRTMKVTLPSDDKRWKLVDATMRRNGYAPNALIESLHTVQQSFGYIDDDAMRFIARSLRVPPSKVYGAATFYNFFSLKPQGHHTCVVCLGTACYIKGGPVILDQLEQHTGVGAGETTPDKEVSLMVARCVGACGLAPVVTLDGAVTGKLAPSDMLEHVKTWLAEQRAEKEPAS